MATKTRHYESTMTLQALQDRCNKDEQIIPGKLKSLEAVLNANGVKVTEAVYEKQADFEGTGKVKLKKGGDGGNTAWIMTVEENIKISRDE